MLENLGITEPILGADGFDSPILLELAGETALNEVYFTNHYSSHDPDPLVIAFKSAFETRYGREPNAFNALGYDLGKFVIESTLRAESLTGEGLATTMANMTDFTGVTGTFSIDEKHNAVKSAVVIGLKDGEVASAAKIGP